MGRLGQQVRHRLEGILIVSCQAHPGSPLDAPSTMALMARAAAAGGAGGIRACGAEDVRAVRAAVDLPLIGLTKRRVGGSPVYITPTFEDAALVARSGADLVAVDATDRPRPDGVPAADLVARILAELGIEVVADVDDVASGRAAARAGATYIATTLSGYTAATTPSGPDLRLIAQLVDVAATPVIAEGRYRDPDQVAAAFAAGAHAVVVGKAITDPVSITRRLAEVTPAAQGGRR